MGKAKEVDRAALPATTPSSPKMWGGDGKACSVIRSEGWRDSLRVVVVQGRSNTWARGTCLDVPSAWSCMVWSCDCMRVLTASSPAESTNIPTVAVQAHAINGPIMGNAVGVIYYSCNATYIVVEVQREVLAKSAVLGTVPTEFCTFSSCRIRFEHSISIP